MSKHMPEILHRLTIEAPPSKVYQALTEERGLASWWTRDTVAEPLAGLTAQFGFANRQTVFRMFIEKLEKDKTVTWKCLDGHPEWVGTIIAFHLEPSQTGTVLNFSHTNWERSDGILPMCSFDWARYLISLKEYVTSGRGTPHEG
jgi:uncharacterized protein YndB with AHSA1/START domain